MSKLKKAMTLPVVFSLVFAAAGKTGTFFKVSIFRVTAQSG
ncbi:hypothetical protein SAMN04487897_12220 [Paenibacillus sp. yr247]|nr:hypothetical protein [Paenibacillus sp. yr247]SDO77873.1 hypothetical protein SAMN04487897_12220 [Paenibacillus sp. yr247]